MNRKVRLAFLALFVVQVLHSIEEYATGFYAIFPPYLTLHQFLPAVPKPGFIVFTLLLFAAGIFTYYFWLKSGRKGWRLVVAIWAVAEGYNAVGHGLWSLLSGGYKPGLITALALIPLIVWLMYLLRMTAKRKLAKLPRNLV